MPDDMKLPTDARLSEVDVKRVLERAAQIDGAQSLVTVSDLARAAHEAGISENAVLQAARELLQDREMVAPADQDITSNSEARARSGLWIRRAVFCCLVLIALFVILVSLRIAP